MSDKNEEIELLRSQIEAFAQRLRCEREKARISQMDLSLTAGLSQNQVNYIETGRRTPTLYTILKICNALHINPAILFDTPDETRQQAKETIISLVSRYL
jgi:transcriptional regulator with XRE-family HTH domain